MMVSPTPKRHWEQQHLDSEMLLLPDQKALLRVLDFKHFRGVVLLPILYRRPSVVLLILETLYFSAGRVVLPIQL